MNLSSMLTLTLAGTRDEVLHQPTQVVYAGIAVVLAPAPVSAGLAGGMWQGARAAGRIACGRDESMVTWEMCWRWRKRCEEEVCVECR